MNERLVDTLLMRLAEGPPFSDTDLEVIGDLEEHLDAVDAGQAASTSS